MEDLKKKNMVVDEENRCVRLKVNVKVYPKDVVMNAAYVFLDKHYVLIDGDVSKEIVVEISPKEKGEDLEKIGLEFFNELTNYADYFMQSEKNRGIRELILQRALFSVKDKDKEDFEVQDKNEKEES